MRRQRAISERVLRAGEQRWRVSRLRLGLRQWKDRCKAARSDRSMQQSRVRVRSSAVMLRTVRTPEVDVARAFRGWARASTAGKVWLLASGFTRVVCFIPRTARRISFSLVALSADSASFVLLFLLIRCLFCPTSWRVACGGLLSCSSRRSPALR